MSPPPPSPAWGGRLSERGLVDRKRYRGARLTDRGEREGLFAQTRFRVEGTGPFGGPVRIGLVRPEVVLGAEIAGQIHVEADPENPVSHAG